MMSVMIIPLADPVVVKRRDQGVETEIEITELEMREPTVVDFASVSVNEPTIGQMIDVAAKCCTNLPPQKFKALSAANLMPIAGWVGGFLHGSR